MNMDPFLIARPADAKTSVSIPNITPSDTEGESNISHNNSHDDMINNNNGGSAVVLNSIYSKTDQENNNNQSKNTNNNSVDQIIDNL